MCVRCVAEYPDVLKSLSWITPSQFPTGWGQSRFRAQLVEKIQQAFITIGETGSQELFDELMCAGFAQQMIFNLCAVVSI